MKKQIILEGVDDNIEDHAQELMDHDVILKNRHHEFPPDHPLHDKIKEARNSIHDKLGKMYEYHHDMHAHHSDKAEHFSTGHGMGDYDHEDPPHNPDDMNDPTSADHNSEIEDNHRRLERAMEEISGAHSEAAEHHKQLGNEIVNHFKNHPVEGNSYGYYSKIGSNRYGR